MDKVVNEQIRAFLQKQNPTDEEIRQGATLLLRMNPSRERGIFNSAMARPRAMLPWIRTDLQKYFNFEAPQAIYKWQKGQCLPSTDNLFALAVILAVFLNRTRSGLNLRAVGESPATADAAGINVTKYKYLATCIGGAMTGLGGLYLVMNAGSGVGGAWVHDCINGYGWLAVALVIFAVWSPRRALWCSLIFGGLSCMRYYYPISFIPASIYDILPYLVTAVVLVFVSLKHSRANQPPASLGLSYFREDR